MAKTWFSIPAPLNRHLLDYRTPISRKSWTLPAVPMKQILFFLVGGGVVAWAAMKTFIASSGVLFITLWVIFGVIAVLYLGGVQKTGELRVMQVPVLLSYLPKAGRRVLTRRSSSPTAFGGIVGIERIDRDGRIHFFDGTVGQLFLIVGSASYLHFDEDRNSIVDRVDAFWRKISTNCELLFLTKREPQRIYHQVDYLERRNQALEIRDPDLIELQNEQYDILTQHVGGKFSSIHQYLLLKGDNAEALERSYQVLRAEVEGSNLMIKELTALDEEETCSTLRVLFQGVDDEIGALGLRSAA